MNIISEVEKLVGKKASEARQIFEYDDCQILAVFGPVVDKTSVISLLPDPDYSAENIEVNEGQTESIYGFDDYTSLIILVELNDGVLCHAQKYELLEDYKKALEWHTPKPV